MRKPTRSLLSLLLALMAGPLFSLPPTESAHGVIVKFRNAAKSTYRSRDQLHAGMGTDLVYRPKRSPYDFVLPKSEELRHNLAALAKLCENYQSTTGVLSCEINFDLFSRGAAPQCNLASNPAKDGQPSPFWAQEATGLDLVAFPRNAVRMGVGVTLGIVDQGFGKAVGKRISSIVPSPASENTHGALVMGLLNAPLPFSVQAPVVITHQFEVRHTVDYLKLLDTIEDLKQAPAILQIAVDLGKQSEVSQEVFARLAKRSILIAAAEASWPEPLAPNEKRFPGILVGSLSPQGFPSLWSTFDQPITISAPSDRSLLSTLDGTAPKGFGGTSGASAIVASLVAAAKSLVPDLQREEVQAILDNTSLPTAASQKGYKGYASVNAVKFLAVADRIRAEGLSGSKRQRALLGGGRLYRFEKEAEKGMEESLLVLRNADASCDARQKAFNQLRRSFFLNPTPSAIAAFVGVLNNNGLKSNARFYQAMEPGNLPTLLTEDIESAESEVRANAAKMAALLGADSLDLLAKYAESISRAPASEGLEPKIGAERVLGSIVSKLDPERAKALVQKLKLSKSPSVKKLGETLSPSN
jgi:hypothetical protein